MEPKVMNYTSIEIVWINDEIRPLQVKFFWNTYQRKKWPATVDNFLEIFVEGQKSVNLLTIHDNFGNFRTSEDKIKIL